MTGDETPEFQLPINLKDRYPSAGVVLSTLWTSHMGHRLTTILSALNAVGLFACFLLIALASSKDPLLGVHITQAIRHSLRMFVVGAALPALACGIAALELDRTNARIRLVESWAMYFLFLASLVLFVVAAWRLPHALMRGFQGMP